MLPPLFTPGIVGWLLVLVFGGLWLLDQHLELAAALLTGIAFLAILWCNRQARRRYSAQVAQYELDFDQYLTYPERQAAYEEALRQYACPDTLPLYRKQQVASLLRSISLPLYAIPSDEEVPRQGRSEAYFLAYLQQYFGQETIHAQCRVPVDDPRLATAWYYPDFVYWDATGLRIDIEIDEPYTLRTKEPIHYQGQDDTRNAYFLRKNWVVVRFTEEQVVRYPKQCCKELAELIFSVNETHYAAKFFSQRLPPVAQWSQQQALGQARADTRNTYLSLLSRGVAW
ncbi:hypothetical protein DNI29_23140 [Hymenobacter sediminis]|uniref:hypothetical protein n=1 Tax=Hymenobacter sediminis TaxID=2218621 RepID=UPI000F4FB259|nr:hypothetical protein [Hymenobacter sediminis]RPD43758.1 hypothetical protein DNI29_23140 [Hymenobacter sediminis]